MLLIAGLFLLFTITAGIFEFGGYEFGTTGIAEFSFYTFLVLFVVALIIYAAQRKGNGPAF